MKRVVTKIGNVFSVKLDDGKKNTFSTLLMIFTNLTATLSEHSKKST